MKRLNLILKAAIVILLSACVVMLATGCFPFDFSTPTEQDNLSATEGTKAKTYEKKLDEVLSIIDKYYVDDYDTEELGDYLAQAAVSATGDRWSYYISADQYNAYVESNENAYVGIGVTIQLMEEDDEGFTIVSVTHNSPAEKAGIQNGDMMIAVEGESAVKIGMTETQKRVRGNEGTKVKLTLRRDGKDFDVTVKREVIQVEVVKYELLADKEGYIKINNFDAHCAENTIHAIDDLMSQGATSLIFDLRFNPGGRKDELVKVLDYLLPEGPLFRSVDYRGHEEIDYSDESSIDLPMAVIVNDDSYSAAEFFAAALQEYGVGVVVGTKTCGKANYQQTFRLSDGSAIAISTGHYQTPKGVTLADVGVAPDVVVEVDKDTYTQLYYEQVEKADDTQLQAAIKAIKK